MPTGLFDIHMLGMLYTSGAVAPAADPT